MTEATQGPRALLSSTDMVVLHMIADGHSMDEIRRFLGVSSTAVDEKIGHILRVLSASSHEQAIVKAIEQGLLGPAGPGFRIVNEQEDVESAG